MSYSTFAGRESDVAFWTSQLGLAEGSEIPAGMMNGDGYEQFGDNNYQQFQLPPVERMVLTRGSVNKLQDQDFFWSGNTLENLYFNDRQPWQNASSETPYPYEYLPRTTTQDIIEIFNTAVPSLFRPHQAATLMPYSPGDWFLAYLDGTADNALEFRKAVLDSVPPPPVTEDDIYCTFLEIFCLGILPSIRYKLPRCPNSARVLTMMRANYTITADADHFHFYGA
ncbi:hypothetical protein QBC37DRAFT_395837 [Rhypophila decipiens]|uniref:Uncharacterized protein n=1 Tax=Rhypophila decipiens TaxID=261697 RepID=A0AAN7BC92_9PEZI|nr:hypothetical protein QBC37DRAFT_395837 [Rhypophila decipiens]